MPGKIVLDKKMKTGVVLLLIVVLIASASILVVFGSNGGLKNDPGTTTGNGSSELYLFAAPNYNTSNVMTKTLDDGNNFTFNQPGSLFNFTINTTIDIAVFIINHENQDMHYSLIAYQAQPDLINNSFNMTQLYYSPIDVIPDNSARQCLIHIKPAYVANGTHIGVALLDSPMSNSTKMLNSTDIIANIYPN